MAVEDVNLDIKEGEIFGLLGPNGAGKTTTINMLIGLARITAGSVTIAGTRYTDLVGAAQGLMGVVPDESNLYDELTGFENLCFCGSLYGMRKGQRELRARQLLEIFDLAKVGDKPFRTYSKGMKRKLTIAAGIIHSPKILFLDEPTTGIDVASAREIRRLITALNEQGTTVFLTTHYIEEAERLCHRIAFIVSGKIVQVGATGDLLRQGRRDHVVQFTLDRICKGERILRQPFQSLPLPMVAMAS